MKKFSVTVEAIEQNKYKVKYEVEAESGRVARDEAVKQFKNDYGNDFYKMSTTINNVEAIA